MAATHCLLRYNVDHEIPVGCGQSPTNSRRAFLPLGNDFRRLLVPPLRQTLIGIAVRHVLLSPAYPISPDKASVSFGLRATAVLSECLRRGCQTGHDTW